MADFCKQCSIDMGFDEPDLDNITTEDITKEGKYATVICEGCGITQVDHEGTCIGGCMNSKHNNYFNKYRNEYLKYED